MLFDVGTVLPLLQNDPSLILLPVSALLDFRDGQNILKIRRGQCGKVELPPHSNPIEQVLWEGGSFERLRQVGGLGSLVLRVVFQVLVNLFAQFAHAAAAFGHAVDEGALDLGAAGFLGGPLHGKFDLLEFKIYSFYPVLLNRINFDHNRFLQMLERSAESVGRRWLRPKAFFPQERDFNQLPAIMI